MNCRRMIYIALAALIALSGFSLQCRDVEAAQKGGPLVKKMTVSGYNVTFKKKVRKNDPLPANTVPANLMLTGEKKSIRLNWQKPANQKDISGYLILRKKGKEKRWKHIATVPKARTSYTDKKAKKKNKRYYYNIVAYKKVGKTYRISPRTASWVSGVTTRSKTVNVYSPSVRNQAALSAMQPGMYTKILLNIPAKGNDKRIRWTSANPKVAAVDSNGVVAAKAKGTTTVFAKTATGRVVRVPINVIPAPKPAGKTAGSGNSGSAGASKPAPTVGTADGMVSVMRSWIGFSESNKKHRSIIDIYNSYGNLPVGYKVKYSDAWCDACISAAAIRSNNVETVGRECGVPRHITIFRNKGIWIEDGTITPKKGDIIVYAWSKSKQPNDNAGSHIGIVESVSKGKITAIEGNYRDAVGRRTIPVGWGHIRGFARPKYAQ